MVAVVAGVACQQGRYLITSRPPGHPMAGKWEFPGGKIESGESPEEALSRELLEELGMAVRVQERLLTLSSEQLEISFYAVTPLGEPQPLEGQSLQWREADRLLDVELCSMDETFVRQALLSSP